MSKCLTWKSFKCYYIAFLYCKYGLWLKAWKYNIIFRQQNKPIDEEKKIIGELTLPTRQSAERTAWPVSIELNLLLQDEDPFDVLIVLSTGSEA